MVTKKRILPILLVAAVAITSAVSLEQVYAQSVSDNDQVMFYSGNSAECWMDKNHDGIMDTPCAIDSGSTVWILMTSALVLLMTPGVAFFYGGLARTKNVVNTMGMVFIIIGLISVQWVLWGYSIAFGPATGGINQFVGSFDYVGLNQVSNVAPLGTPNNIGGCLDTATCHSSGFASGVPHQVFMMFQGTFAILTPALVVGGLIDRMKFSALIIFVILWASFVYDPVAHWVRGGGFLAHLDLDPSQVPSSVLDFAGGTFVHITAGFSALAAALVLGKRLGLGKIPMQPHNIPMVILGASLLWFGWFGFTAGSRLAIDGIASNAFVVTNISAGMASVTWLLVSWAHTGRPSIVGAATGGIAGLVAITPASGWVGPMAALIIGIAAGTICYGAIVFKNARKLDDALDAWGVHGIGGLIGVILTGVLASPRINGGWGAWTGTPAGIEQLEINSLAALFTLLYAFIVTIIILKIMDAAWPGGIRVTAKEEEVGLDLAQHGERSYTNE